MSGCRLLSRTCGPVPLSALEQRAPVPEEEQVLMYDVYGWYKFEGEPEGVMAPERMGLSY